MPERDDKPVLPEDAVEDLAPDEEGEDVKGGAIYAKLTLGGNKITKIDGALNNVTGPGE